MIKGYAKALAAVLCFAFVAVLLSHSSVQAVTQIAPCTEQGQATGCVTPQVIQRSVCDNEPGLCKPQTATVVPITCGATLTTFINSSSPSGTVYQLAGNATTPCTYSSVPQLTVASNITIQGDCSSPVGAYTILDGANAAHPFIYGLAGTPSNSPVNVTIKCLTVQHFWTHSSGCSNNDTIHTFSGWVIRNSSIINNGCQGIVPNGDTKVIDNLVSGNGVAGIAPTLGQTAASSAEMLIQGNEVSNNGTENNSTDAGIKALQAGCVSSPPFAQSLRIANNYVHDNGPNAASVGIWFDCYVQNGVIIGNTVVRNGRAGIAIEISAGAEISHNVLQDNDFNDAGHVNGDWGACLYIQNSSFVNAHDNFCATNASYGQRAIVVVNDCRSDTFTKTQLGGLGTRGIRIYGNTVVIPVSNLDIGLTGLVDKSTTAGSSSFGALCSATIPGAASATWAIFSNNRYFAQAETGTSGQFFLGGTCQYTGSDFTTLMTLASLQAGTGGAGGCNNFPNEAASTVVAPAVGFMSAQWGCRLSAAAGQFCDQRPPPW